MAQDENKTLRAQLIQIEMALLTASAAEAITLNVMREMLLQQLAAITPTAATAA